jgi:Uma2 family endonuclease
MTKMEALNIVRPLPLTVDDFLLLDSSGAFEGYGKTELIEGAVVFMNAQHRPHARIKLQLWREIDTALRSIESDLMAMIEVTTALPPHNAPEPDIVVTSEPDGEGPVPLASVALLVEVADTTLANDLKVKAPIYARHGVPEYWVVDVKGRAITQMWDSNGATYRESLDHDFGETIACTSIVGLAVATDLLN